MSNINAELAEFAKNLWDNYIKEQADTEFENNVWFYRASVTANTGNGLLTVQRPYDNEVTIRCTEPLTNSTVGDTVTVACFGSDVPLNQVAFLKGTSTMLEDYTVTYNTTTSSSADKIRFTDEFGNLPFVSIVSDIVPYQSGSGDPSPTNIRPISGYTKERALVSNDNYFNNEGWTGTSTAVAPTSYPRFGADGYMCFYNLNSDWNCYVYAYDFDGNYIGRTSGAKRSYHRFKKTSFSSGSGTQEYDKIAYLNFRYYSLPSGVTAEYIESHNTIMLLEGDYNSNIQGTFFPHKGGGIIADWTSVAGTVYGGTIDLISGTLTSTYGIIASYNGETLNGKWISDRDVYAEGTTPTTGAQVAYELDSPVIYELGAQSLNTVEGINNVYTTDGKVTATYYIGHNGVMSVNDKYKLDHIESFVSEGTVTSVTLQATSPIEVSDSTPITVSGTRTFSHANSGVTAASKGDTTAQTPAFGGTFKALSGTVNATGHLTDFAEHTVTIPSATATTNADGLMSSADKSKLDDMDASTYAKYGDGVTTTGTAANSQTGISVAITIPATTSIQGVSGTTTASKASGANSVPPTLDTPFTIPNVTGVGSASFTQGTFTQGTLPSLSYTAATKNISLSVGTLPSHAADSFSYTAPTLGESFVVPNVTNAGSASTWQFSNVTVPKAATAIYVPSRATSGDISGTATVTDNGHTHSVTTTGTIDTP